MSNRVWILGASDPEMEAVEKLLTACGESIAYATLDSRRVRPGNAYRMRGYERPPGSTWFDTWYTTAYHVECSPELDRHVHRVGVAVRTIDHRSPGDPGYGKPPAEFMAASSLGQVLSELARLGALTMPRAAIDEIDANYVCPAGWTGLMVHVEGLVPGHIQLCRLDDGTPYRHTIDTEHDRLFIPYYLVLAAAADHCLAAAYRGECPGVDPDELMRWRLGDEKT